MNCDSEISRSDCISGLGSELEHILSLLIAGYSIYKTLKPQSMVSGLAAKPQVDSLRTDYQNLKPASLER